MVAPHNITGEEMPPVRFDLLFLTLLSCTMAGILIWLYSVSSVEYKDCSNATMAIRTIVHQESLSQTYISEFRDALEVNLDLLPVMSTPGFCVVDWYVWNSSTANLDPYGVCRHTSLSDCAYFSSPDRRIATGIKEEELNTDHIHRIGVIAHEWFHVYQDSFLQIHGKMDRYLPSSTPKWYQEGTAALYESMYVRTYHSEDYLLQQNPANNDAKHIRVLTDPGYFESSQSEESNYSASLFMVLVLYDRLRQSVSEVDAVRAILGGFYMFSEGNTFQDRFESAFNLTVQDLYSNLTSGAYNASYDYTDNNNRLMGPGGVYATLDEVAA